MTLCRIFRPGGEDPFSFLSKRSVNVSREVADVVADIIEAVRTRGDEAILESARRFDSPKVDSILVSQKELESAEVGVMELDAIRTAIRRVRAFHDSEMDALTQGWVADEAGFIWSKPERHGGSVGQRMRPVSSAGIYVPGGKANYPSSVIMNSIPAVSANVGRIAISSPAGENGKLSPAVLVAARECGVRTLAKVGGAAAIAALAFGTESVPRTDVVAGPGNRYVNEAKRQLWGQVGLDLYAGPSEVCVLADDSANAAYAAADWLTQVEHAEDNAGFLIVLSETKLEQVLAEVENQLDRAPRAAVIRKALGEYGAAFVARDLSQALDLVNAIAPEHLTLSIADPENLAAKIENAGCILMGEFTPESGGDYAIGPSHTLPTSTAARFAGPLNVLNFLKIQSLSRLTGEDLAGLVSVIETFGAIEGLPGHGYGGTIRFES